MKSPLSIYVLHHPQCAAAEKLAKCLYDWFRLGYLSGDQSGAGLPIYFRRQLDDKGTLKPKIEFDHAALNVLIVLVDHKLVGDAKWRAAVVDLAEKVSVIKEAAQKSNTPAPVVLLPAAMHDSFYRVGPLYEHFNPVRLLGLSDDRQEAVLRRAVTETAARKLRSDGSVSPPPLKVFLSHAKRDGVPIAECIRDGVRKFSQLEAWYDANDLPFGAEWNSPMVNAAKTNTAAMVVTLTDAYPTRPWCRREATLARTPELLGDDAVQSRIWKVQPVVAVQKPGSNWVRGVPMLEGVPRIGWNDLVQLETTERIVDRLVLEVMLGNVHRKVAQCLAESDENDQKSCYITWVPDAWTLAVLRMKLVEQRRRPFSVRRIIYPGYGLTMAEIAELEPLITSFHPSTRLVSFEEAWQ